MSHPLQSSGKYLSSRQFSPKKEQWAMISEFRALQFEKAKQVEKMKNLEKKRKFKEELDYQLLNKSDAKKQQKEIDLYYYHQVVQRDNELKQKEERERKQKNEWQKNLANSNKKEMELKYSRGKEKFHSSFDIGYASEQLRKQRQNKIRREVIDTLDKQLHMKAQQKQIQQKKQIEQFEENMRYQMKHFDQSGRNRKKYQQNQSVYAYYQDLLKQKKKREKSIDYMLVEEAKHKFQIEENKKNMRKEQQKRFLNRQMKEILGNQIKIHQLRKQQQRKLNPEEHSYSYMESVFRDNSAKHDKKKYFEYLRNQAAEQNEKKRKFNHMSDEEYRINMNQLDRLTSGRYSHNKYIDRSVSSIGEYRPVNASDLSKKMYNKDSEVVKSKIHMLKEQAQAKAEEKEE